MVATKSECLTLADNELFPQEEQLMSELSSSKRRARRMEVKLNKIKALTEEAKNKQLDVLSVSCI